MNFVFLKKYSNLGLSEIIDASFEDNLVVSYFPVFKTLDLNSELIVPKNYYKYEMSI